MTPIDFPAHPKHCAVGRLRFSVSASQQRRYVSQFPGLDVPGALDALLKRLRAENPHNLPQTASTYERLIADHLKAAHKARAT